MSWKETTTVSLREEFVVKALEEERNMSELYRAYGISTKTGYKWLNRYLAKGPEGLRDRSRRPHHSPNQTPKKIEQLVLDARRRHPAWSGRKLKRWLENQGYSDLPAPSTITAILRRHGMLDEKESLKHRPCQRFEKARPNEMWQMDFKGHFALESSQRCHPLTVLGHRPSLWDDDHSRFLVGLRACPDETRQTVQTHTTDFFRTYGLPERMLMDNGSPWGNAAAGMRYTRFTVWLLQLGIRVSHGRPYHPQTQGKDERLHRTLINELLSRTTFDTLPDCQSGFDAWRQVYNHERPHDALNLHTPLTRYQPGQRQFPEILPTLVFPSDAAVRKVDTHGRISYRARPFKIGKPFLRTT